MRCRFLTTVVTMLATSAIAAVPAHATFMLGLTADDKLVTFDSGDVSNVSAGVPLVLNDANATGQAIDWGMQDNGPTVLTTQGTRDSVDLATGHWKAAYLNTFPSVTGDVGFDVQDDGTTSEARLLANATQIHKHVVGVGAAVDDPAITSPGGADFPNNPVMLAYTRRGGSEFGVDSANKQLVEILFSGTLSKLASLPASVPSPVSAVGLDTDDDGRAFELFRPTSGAAQLYTTPSIFAGANTEALGAVGSATTSKALKDIAAIPSIQFASATSGGIAGTSARVSITRDFNAPSDVTIDVTGGTATPYDDFDPSPVTIHFGQNQRTAEVLVPLFGHPGATVLLTIASATAGVPHGTTTSTLTITAPPAEQLTLLSTANALETVSSGAGGAPSAPVAITGLPANKKIETIAYRPRTGELYGAANDNGVYRIDPATGAATRVGSATFTPFLNTTAWSAFDPGTDRLHVIDSVKRHWVVDPATGAITADPSLTFSGAPSSCGYPGGIAFLPMLDGSTSSTLSTVDYSCQALLRIGDPGAASAGADGGVQTFLTPASVQLTAWRGLTATPTGQLVAVGSTLGSVFPATSPPSGLYFVDPATGAFAFRKTVGAANSIVGVAAAPPANVVALGAASATAKESDGTVTITVSRANTLGDASVAYATADGSAKAGTNYTAAQGTLTFAPGEAAKSVDIALHDDGAETGPLAFSIGLSGASGGPASVGSPGGETITITNVDDKTAPTVTALDVSPSTFRASTRAATVAKARTATSTTMSFTLGEDGAGTLTFAKLTTGRKVGNTCKADSHALHRKPRCTRSSPVNGSVSLAGLTAGARKVRFYGLVGRSALKPGRYRVTLVVKDAAGNASAPVTAGFTVTRQTPTPRSSG